MMQAFLPTSVSDTFFSFVFPPNLNGMVHYLSVVMTRCTTHTNWLTELWIYHKQELDKDLSQTRANDLQKLNALKEKKKKKIWLPKN